ncbi:MAG: hydroxymethylbilane synthase [Methanolinea sp.]|nr:hydroxymethylbilane synthase [Methanolinea sp.]
MSLRIGTRGSALALAQAERVIARLAEQGVEATRVIVQTLGDSVTGVPLHEIGGQGVFVRALDDAILRGDIDAAVHSAKDIPAKRPEGLVTCAVLERDSPADFLVHEVPLEEVRVVGTSSTRRRAQLLRHYPHLEIHPLRGNVDTRLRRLREGRFDAVVLAEAGLQRLGLTLPGTRLPPEVFVPSPNQGTVAVVCREGETADELAAILDHAPTRRDTAAERVAMEEIGGGCYTPLGIYCRDGYMYAEVLSLSGDRAARREGPCPDASSAHLLARDLRAEAAQLIREAHERLGVRE